jgi:small subunit ribosomal protein S17
MTENTSEAGSDRGQRKTLRGIVVANKMAKTITVQVERMKRHPLYHKTLRVRRKFYAHDEAREARLGDVVEIASTRPLSKLKRWRLVQILERAAD